MKYNNKHIFQNAQPLEWRMTNDGFLRCTARVQEAKVLQYSKEEVGDRFQDLDKDVIDVFVSGSALAEEKAIASLEGAPIVAWEHVWADPSVIKEVSVGSVAGTPTIQDNFLVCDFLITDTKTIEQIKSGEIGEVSAAYYADTILEPGVFDGNSFDARQENLQYNHVAIIPAGQGRAGGDVRITNKSNKKEETIIVENPVLVKVASSDSKKFMNMDEDSTKIYLEEKENKALSVQKLTEAMNQAQSDVETYKEKEQNAADQDARIAELEGELAVYKAKVEEMGDESLIEQRAMGMVEDQEEAGEIMENAELVDDSGEPMDESATDEYKNSIKKIHGDKLRKSVLTRVGIKTENMSSEALKGAWAARKQLSHMTTKKVSGQNMMIKNTKNVKENKNTRSAMQRLGFTKK